MAPQLTLGQSEPESEIELHINAVKALLLDLDSAAETCLAENNDDADSCQEFSDSINGNTIATYLDHCRSLKDWRDQLVEETQTSGLDGADQERTLNRLIDIEFACGEDAMTTHTRYVVSAFEKIRAPRYTSPGSSVAIRNQQQGGSIDYTLRNSLLDGVETQQRHTERELQQMWNRLELENLRRQSQRPIDVGVINQ